MKYVVISEEENFVCKSFETLQEAYNYAREFSYIFDLKIYSLNLFLEV